MPNPRKPTKLKLLEGNRGKRKLKLHRAAVKGNPVPPGTGAPAWLPPQAAALWPEVIKEAGPLATRPHTQALAVLCVLLAEFRKLAKQKKVSTKLAGELRQYFNQFGMTEAALGKLSGEPAKDEEPGDLPPELRDASGT